MNAPHEAPGGSIRMTGIGASECAAALGMSQYQTPLDIYLRKIGESEPVADNVPMRMGRLLEPIVLDLYESEAGPINRQQHTLQAEAHPFMFATPDAINLAGVYPVDAKTVGARSLHQWGEPGTDQVPTDYLLQVTHQMIVTGATRADIAVLMAGQDFAIYPIERDPELVDMIVEGLRQFWARVERREPPAPTTAAQADRLYRRSVAREKEADAQTASVVAELAITREQIKVFERHEEALTLELKSYLANADTLVYQGRTVATWKSAKDGQRFDADAFRREHPDLHAQYMKTTPGSRRLLLKGA